MNYECHITVPATSATLAAEIAVGNRWKTSQIARDPVLGDDTFFYLTKHGENLGILIDMDEMVLRCRVAGVPVLRAKIELVIFDTKRGDSHGVATHDGDGVFGKR